MLQGLKAMRGSGESYSDVILRLAAGSRANSGAGGLWKDHWIEGSHRAHSAQVASRCGTECGTKPRIQRHLIDLIVES
jgi:hypothetical protein